MATARQTIPDPCGIAQTVIAAFAFVNLFAVLQTWLVSMGLRNWLLPLLGVVVLSDLIAHGIGVAVPVLSSYFGHKHISFHQKQ